MPSIAAGPAIFAAWAASSIISGLPPFANLIDGAAQDAPIGADRLVRLPEMFLGAILDRAHRFAGPLVVHVDICAHAGERLVLLLARIEAVIVALVLARDVIRQLVELEPLAPHLVLVDRAQPKLVKMAYQ